MVNVIDTRCIAARTPASFRSVKTVNAGGGMSQESMSGQRVVVLGGTSGLGLAAAKAAASVGARVVVVSSRAESVSAATAQITASAGVEGCVVNLADEANIEDFFSSIGRFDHLVYTAGEAIRLGELDTVDLDAARNYFGVRVWGAYAAVKHAHSRINSGGSIVLTTGIASRRPLAGWSLGAMICSAIEGLTRALAVELRPLRVNAVCPGVVRTPLWREMSDGDRAAMYRGLGELLPVGYVGEADDVAEAYLFLMRERYASGHVLVVDGGAVLV
jgi:NAD(P)-dependent dehydrogenase (short-subunit alcohol dehydrogenase family)